MAPMTPTPSNLPDAVTVQSDGRTTRYILPERNLGKSGCTASAGLILVGAIPTLFMLFWIVTASGILRNGFRAPQNGGDWIQLAFAALGLPGLLAALTPIALGIGLLLRNNSEIELDDHHLRAIERFGPVRLRFKRPANAVKRLTISRRRLNADDADAAPRGPAWTCITATGDFRKPLRLAPGYDRPLLEALAHDLSARIGAVSVDQILHAGPEKPTPLPVDVEPDVASDAAAAPAPDQPPVPMPPPDTRAQIAHAADTLTITIPPQGFRGMARSMLTFSIFWLIITGTLSLAVLVAVIAARDIDAIGVVVALGIGGVFWAVGLGTLYAAVSMARRRCAIVATPDSLVIITTTLRGEKEREFPANAITSITAGPSGTSINNRPVLHMAIETNDGKSKGVLAGYNEPELRYLAALLNHHYTPNRQNNV